MRRAVIWMSLLGICWVASKAFAINSDPCGFGRWHQLGVAGQLVCNDPCGVNAECEKEGPLSPAGWSVTMYTWDVNAVKWKKVGPAPGDSEVYYCVCVEYDPVTGEEVLRTVGNLNCCRTVEILNPAGQYLGTAGTCAACPAAGSCTLTGAVNNAEADCVEDS